MNSLHNGGSTGISLDDALTVLHPRFEGFAKSVEVGWQAWSQFEQAEPELRLPLDDSAEF